MTTMTLPLIDVYDSAESRSPSGSLTLPDFIDAVRSEEFKDKIERLRKLKASGKEDDYNNLKRKLPAVTISGECAGPR